MLKLLHDYMSDISEFLIYLIFLFLFSFIKNLLIWTEKWLKHMLCVYNRICKLSTIISDKIII